MQHLLRLKIILALALTPFMLSAQTLKKSYIREFFFDDFNNNKSQWAVINSRDNLFLVQDGSYMLYRKNEKAPFLIYNEHFIELDECSIQLNCTLDENNDTKSFVGLVFLIQDDKKGAFILDISTEKRYRIRQLAGVGYQYLTGDERQEGWVKSPVVKNAGEENQLKVNISQNTADIYINNQYLTTITNPAYRSGRTGIVIGPTTKAFINSIRIQTP